MVVLGNTFTQGYKSYNFKYTEEDLVEFVPITISDLLKDNYYTTPLQNVLPTHKLHLLYSEPTCHIGALAWMREVFHEDGIKTLLWMLGDMHVTYKTLIPYNIPS